MAQNSKYLRSKAMGLVLLGIFFMQPMKQAHAFKPEKPTLIINKDNNVCRPFLKSWSAVFSSGAPLNEAELELENFFPHAKIISFPEEKPQGADGPYEQAYSFKADLDGDKKLENLGLSSNNVGWRYLGATLYLQNDESALSKNNDQKSSTENDVVELSEEESKQYFTDLYEYVRPPPRRVHFIQYHGYLYTLSSPGLPTFDKPATSELLKVNVSGTEKICEVRLLPEKKKYKDLTDKGLLFESLTNVYGGGDGCMGTMGWKAEPLDSSLSNIFERPQLLYRDRNVYLWGESLELDWRGQTKIATQLRFMSWALSDPVEWRSYNRIMASKPAFILYLEEYYKQFFKYNNDDANSKAEQAWQYWLNSVIYATSQDTYHITKAAEYISGGTYTNSELLVNAAYDALLQNKDNISEYAQKSVYPELLVALIYTRSEPSKIKELYQIIKNQNHSEKNYQDILDRSLLASLGDEVLTNISIDHGANINAETNWYKKTPLMYAAQTNNLDGIEYLIKAGVNLNARTDGSEYRCTVLERDNRTALMYAAENADKDVILSLINAGADISAKDSQGNMALWYFEKNTKVKNVNEREDVKKILLEIAHSNAEAPQNLK